VLRINSFGEQCYQFTSVFNQLDAQNLLHNKFYFMPLHVSSTMCSSSGIITPIGVMIPEAV